MNMFWEQFLWVICPYLVATIFVTGHIFRYITDQSGWTTKSSEFLEKSQLKWGIFLFHFGIFAVVGGHISGLLVPRAWFLAVGITDKMYHLAALGGGGIAGVATVVGVLCLLVRRFGNQRVLAVSSFGDGLVIVFLFLEIGLGLFSTASGLVHPHGFDYRETIAPWLRGVLVFAPDMTLMSTVPTIFKAHILFGLAIFAIWPFTRLVHVWSVPVEYLGRIYIQYRTRDLRKRV